MKRLLLSLVLPLLAIADEKVDRGAAIYRSTCAVAYCHGSEGKPGRAPGFIGRKLEPAAVGMTVSFGIPNTSMPAFASSLKEADIEAVVAYVASLGSTSGVEPNPPVPVKLPPEIERGRVLFFDPGRMGSCGNCHEMAGRGVPVSLALHNLRIAQLDLRSVKTPAVVTVNPAGEEPFPAVVAEKSAERVRVYDLSARLPVLRSFAPSDMTIGGHVDWQHTNALDVYNRGELEAIERYLKWLAAR